MVSVGAGADRILRDGALRRLRTPPVGGASGVSCWEEAGHHSGLRFVNPSEELRRQGRSAVLMTRRTLTTMIKSQSA